MPLFSGIYSSFRFERLNLPVKQMVLSLWHTLQFARAHSPEILFEPLRGTEMVNSIYIYIEKYNLQFYSPMYIFILYIY